MKYEQWCVKFYEQIEGFPAEDEKKAIEFVTGRLVVRLNCVTGKYYGGKHIDAYYYKYLSESEKERLDKDREDKINGLRDKYKRCEEVVKKLGGEENVKIPRKEQEKIDVKKASMDRIKKEYQNLMQSLIDAPLGKGKRFDDLEECEVKFFEFLLSEITEEKLKRLNKDRWEELSVECRRTILEYLYAVQELGHWEITENDMEDILFKFYRPSLYRFNVILNELEWKGREKGEEAVQEAIEKELNKINNSLEKLYKLVSPKSFTNGYEVVKKEKTTANIGNEEEEKEVEEFTADMITGGVYLEEAGIEEYPIEIQHAVKEFAQKVYATKE